ncbi:MAG TPA: ribosomal protein S18-alanine N-acetyltransferase [Acidobacteriota bacterium]|nr:ribosomal protein S18-alanine N-acetyltransferase [Acidobacteriota bacterium]
MSSSPDLEKGQIRLATFEDIPALQRLDTLCALNGWNAEIYKSLILNDSCEVTVWTNDRSVIGFCAIRTVKPEVELLKIGVHPRCQGQGIGAALLNRALNSAVSAGCQECFLEVRWGNERALAFYIKEGFEMVGIRRQYYRDPVEDARVMRKKL